MKKIIYLLFAIFACQFLTAQSILPPDTIPYLLPDSVVPYSEPIGQPNYVGGGHDVTLFAGGTSRFQAQTDAVSYSWSPSTGLSDTTISNPYVSVNTTTTYTVRIQTLTDTNYYSVRAIVITPASTSAASCNNWVINGDFESASGCTYDVSNLNWQTNWANAGGSCDFFTACNTSYDWHSWWGVLYSNNYVEYPVNAFGTQFSSGYGQSYAGLITTSFSTQYPYFEYTQSQLACSLITGQRYKMQFDASWAANSNFSCGNIGMYVTTNAISAPNGSQIVATPQVDGSCGTNTHWTTFSNTYTGAGEQYVTIGNFDVNPASQNVCPRLATNMLPEFPLSTVHPALDNTYNYLDNIIIYPIPPDLSATYSVNCAGLGTPPTNQNNILTETGSPGSLCSWYGPGGAFLGTGASIPITTPNVAGTYVYTVSVNLNSECSLCTTPLINTISIQVLPLSPGPVITPTISSGPVCANYHTGLGSVNGHIVSPTSGTHYIWDPVLIPANGTGSSGHFSLPPGVYTVNVTTSNCSGLGTTTFTINPFPVFTVTTSTPSLCYGVNTATLTASDPTFSYSWTPSSASFGLSSTSGSVVVANPTATSIYASNHVYTANTINGFGCVASETVSVKTALTPTVQISKLLTGAPCSVNHPTYTLTANGLGSGTGGTDVWTAPTVTSTSIVVSPSSTTVYTLTETTAAGCVSSGVTTATVNATPTVSIAASSTSICRGSSPTFTVYATPTNSTTTYSWGGGTSTSNTYTPPPLGPTITNHTYTVYVHTNGCQGTATININVNPLPLKPTFGGSICSGATSVLTVTNTTGSETYSWAAPSGASISCNNPPTCNSETIYNAIAGGVYSVTATDANGCVSPTATIVPKNSPSVYIYHGGLGTDCANAPRTFTLTGIINPGNTSTNTYNWSTGATTNPIVVTPTSTTIYTLTGTSGTTGCVNTGTLEIVITPNPTVNVSSSPVCTGASTTLTASAAPTGTTNYTWAGFGVSGPNTHSNPLYTPIITTPKTYTLSANVNGCPSNTITITITPLPRPTITAAASPTIICQGSSSSLSANGALTYTWTPSTSVSPSTGTPVTATPSVTTQYTVQGSDANGCIGIAFDNVTVKTSPTLTITAPNYTICEGSSVNLTAHGSTNYTWTPDPSLSATTGSVVTVTPSVTTVYTVAATSTVGCNSVGTVTITVTPAPSLTITAAADPICSGMTTTLTASGATTYTWTNGTGLGINSTNNHSVTITTPTLTSSVTYTLTGTVGACKGSTVLTVTVNPPPIVTFSLTPTGGSCSTPTAICQGDPVTITANSTSATSYTWNPGGSNDNPITFTTSTTGNIVYTVTASDDIGCTSVSTTTVVVSNCTAGFGHLPMAGNITGGNFAATGSFTLTGNLALTNCNVILSPGVTITVPSPYTLHINNSYLHAVSNSMWQGIVVQPGAEVDVINGSMIEDAIVAIDNGGTSSTPNFGSPAKMIVAGAIFNCNRTAIRQAFYQSTTPANYSTTNFSIQASVVTCRCGISQAAGVAPLEIYSGGGTLANPTINDFYSVANYTAASLKYPYAGQPAFEGVHLENNGQFGNPTPSNFAFTVGGLKLALFDNLTYGVNAINASFIVTKAAFQLPRLSGAGGIFNFATVGGYGVNSVNNVPDWWSGIYVNGSQFIRMVRAIQSVSYYDIDINNNTIFSLQTASPVGGPQSLYPPEGDYGMYIKSPRFIGANMSSNNLANINTGIDFVIDQSTGYNGGNGEFVSAITINNNTMADQFPTTSYTNRFIGNGIVVDNVIVPTSTTTTGPVAGTGTEISIRNNTITQAYRGILARNQEYQIVRTENNVITMQLESSFFSNSFTTQYGIEHNRVAFLNTPVFAGYPTIFNNTVTGFITPADYGNQPYFEPKKGIWANQTVGHYVSCNTVTNAGRAMEFTGNNSKTLWRLNQMNTSGEGFVLSAATGGGIIGTQGAVGDGIDNVWSGFSITNPETYVDNLSNASSSPLYLQNLTGYVPLNNATNGIYPYVLPLGTLNLFDATSPSTTYDCSTGIAGIVINPKNNPTDSTSPVSNSNMSDTTIMNKIVQDSMGYVSDSSQNSFINKNIVYRQLKQDTTQMTNSPVLKSFYNASQTTSRQLFCTIEDSLYQGGYTNASTLVNSFMPGCTIEQNYQRFYQIYIDGMQNNFTSTDSTDLETLASSCPLLNGSVVFQARAFHNSFYNSFKHYEDNCPQADNINSRKANQVSSQSGVNKASSIIVYPNPNNGKVYVTGFTADEKTTMIEITDVTGKLVYKQQNNIGNGVIELNLPFVSGVYFVHVVSASGKTQIQKIVITN